MTRKIPDEDVGAPPLGHLPVRRITITIEVTREAGADLGLFEGALLTQKDVFELDPVHSNCLFANGANEGWPSRFMGEIEGLPKIPTDKIMSAHGYLLCNGLVTRKLCG